MQKAGDAKEKIAISQIEEELKLAYNDTAISKIASGDGTNVSIADWMFRMIDDGMNVILEQTENENEYFVTIDGEDDLYVFNISNQSLSKYNKQFSSDWYKEYTYTTDNTTKTITLTKYIGQNKVAYIGKSAKIGGTEYTTIFKGQKDSNGNVTDTVFGETVATKVKLQNGIPEIGEYAFYDNSNLKSIIIPNGVTIIGNQAVHGNLKNIETVYIPQGVLSLTNAAFNGCPKLKTIVSGAKEMINSSFTNCNQIENIKFLEGAETITNGAFAVYNGENNKLKEIVFPNSMKVVRNSAFQNYTGLKKVVLPSGSEDTGGSSFSGCNNLEELAIGTKVIKDGAFSSLPRLQRVEFLEGIETITGGAFSNCPMLKSIKLPAGIKTIEYGAFSNCTSLTEITIPDTIENIVAAFSVNDSLKTILNTTSEVAKNYDWLSVKRIINNNVVADAKTLKVGNTDISTVDDLSTLYGQNTNYKSISHPDITWQLFYADQDNYYVIANDYVPNAELPCNGNTGFGETDLAKSTSVINQHAMYCAEFCSITDVFSTSYNNGVLTTGTIYKNGASSTAITRKPISKNILKMGRGKLK